MGKSISRFIADQYEGGSHGFRMEKRRLIREILIRINDLRCGCVDFPNGPSDVEELTQTAERIHTSLSVKNWGR